MMSTTLTTKTAPSKPCVATPPAERCENIHGGSEQQFTAEQKFLNYNWEHNLGEKDVHFHPGLQDHSGPLTSGNASVPTCAGRASRNRTGNFNTGQTTGTKSPTLGGGHSSSGRISKDGVCMRAEMSMEFLSTTNDPHG